MKKLKFYVMYGVSYNSFTGGLIALHKLVHNLCLLGEETYTNAPHKNPLWLGKIYNGEAIDYENSVVIYPEVVIDNPANFKYVVRWLLYDRGIIYPKTDWMYSYWNYFSPHKENKSQYRGLLSAFDIQKEVFYDRGGRIKGKYCHVIRKGAGKIKDKHPSDSICIDNYPSQGGNEYLAKVFSECEYLISYDDATFLTSQAIMCGCIPIIIPNEGVSEETWKNSADIHRYGHAYGPNDITYAIETRHKFLEVIDNLEKQSLEQTKNFIDNCYKEIYG
jgi:hypothetical protein